MHTAGLDYNATTVSLSLNPWSTMKSVYVGIIDDNIFERSETFMGRLIAVDILPDSVHLEPTIAIATIYDHKGIYACVIQWIMYDVLLKWSTKVTWSCMLSSYVQ